MHVGTPRVQEGEQRGDHWTCVGQHKKSSEKNAAAGAGVTLRQRRFVRGMDNAPPLAPVAAPAAHSSGSKLTLATARRFVSHDVPELDAKVLDSLLEVGADGATRFRCPCFVVRDSTGGRGSKNSSFVTLTKRQRLTDHLGTVSHRACEYCREFGSCGSTGPGPETGGGERARFNTAL